METANEGEINTEFEGSYSSSLVDILFFYSVDDSGHYMSLKQVFLYNGLGIL